MRKYISDFVRKGMTLVRKTWLQIVLISRIFHSYMVHCYIRVLTPFYQSDSRLETKCYDNHSGILIRNAERRIFIDFMDEIVEMCTEGMLK